MLNSKVQNCKADYKYPNLQCDTFKEGFLKEVPGVWSGPDYEPIG